MDENKNNSEIMQETEEAVDEKLHTMKSRIKQAFTFNPRVVRHGSIAVVLSCLFIVLAVLVNMLAGKLVEKFPALSADLTQTKFFELSDETLEFLKNVESDIEIIVMSKENDYIAYDSDGYFRQANTIYHRFETNNDKIKVKYVDMIENPTFITKYPDDKSRITSTSVIVQCGDNYKLLANDDIFNIYYDSSNYYSYIKSSKAEQAIASAILNLTAKNKLNVAFLLGYGEDGYKEFKTFLENNGCNVSDVNLATDEISDDVDLAVIFSPYFDYDAKAVEKVTTWLDLGGKNLIYTPYYAAEKTPQLDALLEQYGMKVGTGIVFENDASKLASTESNFITLAEYANSDFTDDLASTSRPIISALARPIEITDSKKATVMLQGSEKSGVYPLDADSSWSAEKAITGNVIVCAIGQKSFSDDLKSNIMVVGSSIALSDDAFSMTAYNNSDYFVNAIDVTTGREKTGITIAAKALDANQLGITASQITRFGIIFMAVIPVALIVVGFVIWFRRRNK